MGSECDSNNRIRVVSMENYFETIPPLVAAWKKDDVMPRTRKPPHIALGQMTTSQLVAQDSIQRNQLLNHPFPLPGTNDLTVGNMPPHTAIVGSTGSGKTIIQKHLMSAVLASPAEQGGLRFRSGAD